MLYFTKRFGSMVTYIALVDIVKSFNWTYISAVYSEGSYGKSQSIHLDIFVDILVTIHELEDHLNSTVQYFSNITMK